MAEILIVDDDDVIRDTVFELLSTDYKCDTAETAEQALAKLEAEQFEVVLTDISLPGLSGRELLSRVLTLYPGTPVIIVSGISDQEHAEELIKLGAFDYLIKPLAGGSRGETSGPARFEQFGAGPTMARPTTSQLAVQFAEGRDDREGAEFLTKWCF